MVLTGIALAFVLAQAPPARQSPPQTDETVAVQKGARLIVNNFAGDVVVRAWDKDSVHVVARHQSRVRVSVRQTGGGVSVSSSGSGAPGSVDYEISAPAWMPVKIEGTYTVVTVDGTRAEVSATSVRGDVTIKGGTTVVARSVEGEVDVSNVHGKLTVSSVNEKIRIADSSGDIAAETVNGGISMTGIDSKNVDATTVNGNITFEGRLADDGRYAFGTHNGDVALGLSEKANATFTIRTYQGSVKSDFTLEGFNPRDAQRGRRIVATLGSGSADVNLETFGGTIRLRKGSAARPHER